MKDTFDTPSHPSHQTRASHSLCKSCFDPGRSGRELDRERLWDSTRKTSHILSIQKMVIIMLLYILFLRSFSEGGCVSGLGGGGLWEVVRAWVCWWDGGSQFYERNPFERNFLKLKKISKCCPKKWGGGNFTKEIPLNEILRKSQKYAQKSEGGQFF